MSVTKIKILRISVLNIFLICSGLCSCAHAFGPSSLHFKKDYQVRNFYNSSELLSELDLSQYKLNEAIHIKPPGGDFKQNDELVSYHESVPKPSISEISYGEHERHVLDFWKAESESPTPLVFVIHGGGWQGGSKERVNRFADVQHLLNAGISVAAINYRYVSQAPESETEPPVKTPLYDAARALQFVRSKAVEWNIDKTKIGAAGGSAGACSSLWLLYHDDLADSNSSDPISRESTRLQCAAVIGAQTTLDPKQMKEWTPNSKYGAHAFGLRNFQEFLSERENILHWIKEYSPYGLVSSDDPPVCLLYSTPPALGQEQKDPTHTSNFGLKMKEKCDSIGVDCEFIYDTSDKGKALTASEYLIKTLKDTGK